VAARSLFLFHVEGRSGARARKSVIDWQFAQRAAATWLSEHGEPLHPAVLTLEEIILRFGREKRNGKRVVFTNGVSICCTGHIESLETARALGDVLIVGLNSDEA